MSNPAADAARSTASDAYLLLDDHDRVVHVSRAFRAALGHWLGHVIWDHLPEAAEIYGPAFTEARESGEPVETVVFYAGRVKRLTIIPAADGLAVHVDRLAELDLTSLGTLMQSLERIECALAAPASARRGRPAPASLRALP